MTYQEGATYHKLIANRKNDGTADVTMDGKFIKNIKIQCFPEIDKDWMMEVEKDFEENNPYDLL